MSRPVGGSCVRLTRSLAQRPDRASRRGGRRAIGAAAARWPPETAIMVPRVAANCATKQPSLK